MHVPVAALAPIVLLFSAMLGFGIGRKKPQLLARLAEGSTIVALAISMAGAAQLAFDRSAYLVLGDGPLAIVLALDTVGITMAMLVCFVGWIVVRYSRTYVAGEQREGLFHALILTTLSSVLFMVMAGSLVALLVAFLATGLAIRALLLFYPDRPEAQRAAVKFAQVWHAGDAAFALAAILLAWSFGSGDFIVINASDGPLPLPAAVAPFLLVLAALLKSAAFPVHGWLTEVMEAPTPVSALMHAGIINAGGLMLIRMADLVHASPVAMASLVLVGGLTALFGGLVMLTQPSVKTALAWSTIAQMGFLMLQCGLGLWPLALLHMVAHSLYKAHAFLSSGGAIQSVLSTRKPGPVAVPGLASVGKAFVLGLILYAAIATCFSIVFGPKSAQALALGAILVFGVSYLIAQGLADTAPGALTRRTFLASGVTTVGYFGFHYLADRLVGSSLPYPSAPGPLEWALIALTLLSFGIVAIAQALFPHWAHHPAAAGLRVHVANGFYLNAAFDRANGGFKTTRKISQPNSGYYNA